jgi:hypothetical protein
MALVSSSRVSSPKVRCGIVRNSSNGPRELEGKSFTCPSAAVTPAATPSAAFPVAAAEICKQHTFDPLRTRHGLGAPAERSHRLSAAYGGRYSASHERVSECLTEQGVIVVGGVRSVDGGRA